MSTHEGRPTLWVMYIFCQNMKMGPLLRVSVEALGTLQPKYDRERERERERERVRERERQRERQRERETEKIHSQLILIQIYQCTLIFSPTYQ